MIPKTSKVYFVNEIKLSSCDHLLCHINFEAFVTLLPKTTTPLYLMVDGVDTFPPDFELLTFGMFKVCQHPPFSVGSSHRHHGRFLVVSRPGLGIAPVGGFVGFRAFPGLLKESSYSVRTFAIVFIGLSAQTGSFQWQPVKGSFTH